MHDLRRFCGFARHCLGTLTTSLLLLAAVLAGVGLGRGQETDTTSQKKEIQWSTADPAKTRCSDDMLSPVARFKPIKAGYPKKGDTQKAVNEKRATSLESVRSELVFDTRTGVLKMDGAEIASGRCWAPYFVETQDVVTVKVFSKFRTDATVNQTTATIPEDGIEVKGLQQNAAPGPGAQGK